MEQPTIFSATLGLSYPWHITAVAIDREQQRMEITVDFYEGNCFICPTCGAVARPAVVLRETWVHQDFFHFTTFLHARIPRGSCCGEHLSLERPWARPGSHFQLLET